MYTQYVNKNEIYFVVIFKVPYKSYSFIEDTIGIFDVKYDVLSV